MTLASALTVVRVEYLMAMLGLTNDAIVFGQNVIWATAAAVTAIIFSWRLLVNLRDKVSPDVIYLIAGVSVEALALAVHRYHWAGWRWNRAMDADAETIDFYINSYIPTGAVFFAVVGAILVTAPFTRKLFGKWWFLGTSVIALLIWITAAHSPGWFLQFG